MCVHIRLRKKRMLGFSNTLFAVQQALSLPGVCAQETTSTVETVRFRWTCVSSDMNRATHALRHE